MSCAGGTAIASRSTTTAVAPSSGGSIVGSAGSAGNRLAGGGTALPAATMQRRSASERDLVEGLAPRRRQSPSRADRGLFTLPR